MYCGQASNTTHVVNLKSEELLPVNRKFVHCMKGLSIPFSLAVVDTVKDTAKPTIPPRSNQPPNSDQVTRPQLTILIVTSEKRLTLKTSKLKRVTKVSVPNGLRQLL